MKRTAYKGYHSFDYLEPGADYRAFELAAEPDRVKSTVVEVSTEQEDRVPRLLTEHLHIPLHDHRSRRPTDRAPLAAYRPPGPARPATCTFWGAGLASCWVSGVWATVG